MDTLTIIMNTTLTPAARNMDMIIIIRRRAIDSDTWQTPPGSRNGLPGQFARGTNAMCSHARATLFRILAPFGKPPSSFPVPVFPGQRFRICS